MAKPANGEMTDLPPRRDRAARSPDAARTTLPTVATIGVVIAALYFGAGVFFPLAVAILLTFALAPLVSRLRRIGFPRPVAVITVVASAFALIAALAFIVTGQATELARNLPQYQSNLVAKVQSIKEMGAGEGVISRLEQLFTRLGAELGRPDQAAPSVAAPERPKPMPVEVITQQNPMEMIQEILVPLLAPLATAGLIVVVVIFMLMEREDLRDRFIRLVGANDLHRTTQALQEAGKRVGQYLLTQLIVNVIYAVPIGIGLWIIGIPNAMLWGLLALLLRFVPYIGPVIATIFPMLLAIAVDPGWSMLMWTGALFLVIELISNNAIEPWLYGSRTGLSPLAVIVSAIFWTWLWGPLGLLLSTPLTVCLVVLGRHVPQFEFLDVIFGNEPVLDRHARLYQRLLAGDPDEATDHAEEYLQDKDLADFYSDVAIPALILAERDEARGVLSDDQRLKVSASAMTMVANLEELAEAESEDDEEPADGETTADEDAPAAAELPDGEGKVLISAGGRGVLDDAVAAMLSQVMIAQGATSTVLASHELTAWNLRKMDLQQVDCVVLNFLNPDARSNARILMRRLKRIRPGLRVGAAFWTASLEAGDPEVKASGLSMTEAAETINADFVATNLRETVRNALSDAPGVRLKMAPRRIGRKRSPAKAKAVEGEPIAATA